MPILVDLKTEVLDATNHPKSIVGLGYMFPLGFMVHQLWLAVAKVQREEGGVSIFRLVSSLSNECPPSTNTHWIENRHLH